MLPCLEEAHVRIQNIMTDLYMTHRAACSPCRARKVTSNKQALSRRCSRESIASDGLSDTLPMESNEVTEDSDSIMSSVSSMQMRSGTAFGEGFPDYGVCPDRAIVIHFYSPLVPTMDIIDLPGLLPAYQYREDVNGVCGGGVSIDDNSTDERISETQWNEWRQDRLQLVENHALAHPQSIYLAVMEAKTSTIAQSEALALLERLHLQVSGCACGTLFRTLW